MPSTGPAIAHLDERAVEVAIEGVVVDAVCSAPLGIPVVPEVYTMLARSSACSGSARRRRFATVLTHQRCAEQSRSATGGGTAAGASTRRSLRVWNSVSEVVMTCRLVTSGSTLATGSA